MDTGTHIAMGIAIGGLATLDPAIAADNALFQSVMVGTIVGSVAPDLDTILKFKNNASYIKHHRGITHSIPAIFIWGILLSTLIYMIMPGASFSRVWLWTFIAVSLHVLVDLFNVYGTQALLPFSNRWLALGFINTFDPFIFGLHIVGVVAWFLGMNPGATWLGIYLILALYCLIRYLDQQEIVHQIKEKYPSLERVVTSPTMRQSYWRVAIRTKDHFYVGKVEKNHLTIVDQFQRKPLPEHSLIRSAKKDKNIAAFLDFSPIHRWQMVRYNHYTEVRFIDLRYRSKGHYPFVAIAQIQHEDLQVLNSYTGWVFSEQKLQQKLYV